MDFGLAPEEKALADALSHTLAKVCSPARVRAWETDQVSFDDAFQAAILQGGFLEAGLPGSDCPSFSTLVQLEEVAGRFLAPPLLSWQSAYAAFLLEDPSIAGGGFIAPVPPGRAQVRLSGSRLSGVADGVSFLDRAERVLLVVPLPPQRERLGEGAASTAAMLVPKDQVAAQLVPTQSLVPQWRLTFQDAEAEIKQSPRMAEALTRLRAGLAAWSTGAGAQAIDLAAAYARERVQFDHPIGSYQSVQNRLVDAAVQVEQARMLVYRAAALIDAADPRASDLAILARHHAGKAFVQASRAALLTHGGYGFTVDFDVQLYFRRAKEAQLAFEPRPALDLAPAFRELA